ncbi:MAG: Crp/Fnr family transcriptional regulator [Rubrivivax sp.]|nr:Crp/Fnr family transcriptional regulator [Rubrivivax sp.]
MSKKTAPTADPAALIEQAPFSDGLRALARRGEARRVRKGTQLITEGDQGDTLFLVVQGRLRAYSAGADEREVTYATYGPGEYLGEMSLDGGPRSANVEVVEPGWVVLVTRRTLDAHLAADPQFAYELLAKVIRRARTATLSLRQIALNDVYGRLKALLEAQAVALPDGTRALEPAPSHLEMSRLIGCGREMVSRVMKDLERGGYVESGRRHVRLLKALPAKW